MKELIYASDIVIFPQEKMYAKMDIPLVLIEALSLKKPIIIADISPLREILNKNGPGVLVPPLDPLALCKAILQLLKDKKRRETIGEKGPKLVEQKYDIKKMAKEYEDIYQRLLS
jgi:glycosyltransferase involved in cell wall biosynthesis